MLCQLQVAPALPKPVESAALTSQTEAEGRRDMEASTGFRAKLQEWWQEYRRDALSLQPEGVMRLTASGEDGRQRSCCAFVRPLQLGRSAALMTGSFTPELAARLSGVLPHLQAQIKVLQLQETQQSSLAMLLFMITSCMGPTFEARLYCSQHSRMRARQSRPVNKLSQHCMLPVCCCCASV